MMLVNQSIQVTLEAWQWVYLTGWAEAHRSESETVTLTDILASIAAQVKP